MYRHKTATDRQIITNAEYSKYLGISVNTFKKRVSDYETIGNTYNSRDILSILDFYKFATTPQK